MKIGDIVFGKYPVFLAPMEDVTDPAFRAMCKDFGVDMVYTEFVSSDALVRQVKSQKAKMVLSDSERPAVIQIYGREPDAMAEAAKIAEEARPDIIDINFGCPVRKIAGKGAGSGLLRDIPRMLAITKAVSKAVNIPVTVKTRLGWDNKNLVITEIAEQLQDAGAKALAIHGRTREQMYKGEADWTLIGKVKENPRIIIPVIGNGDITSAEDAEYAFRKYGVDAIMVGRASIGAPWIFGEIANKLRGEGVLLPSTLREKSAILLELIRKNVERSGEKRGIIHSRRHLAVTPAFKGLPGFKETRVAILRAESYAEIEKLIEMSLAFYEPSNF